MFLIKQKHVYRYRLQYIEELSPLSGVLVYNCSVGLQLSFGTLESGNKNLNKLYKFFFHDYYNDNTLIN